MWIRITIAVLTLMLSGCSVSMPSINLFKGSHVLSPLLLPAADSGYSNLETRVITTEKEYKSFLSAIDTQRYWEHKVAFGMKVAKAHIDFRKENLLIYRYRGGAAKAAIAKIVAVGDTNATIQITDSGKALSSSEAQAFFYKVSKKILEVRFQSKQRVVTVKNTKSAAVVPKECIAWFDGCNHCIRSSRGRPLCTKRYCKEKKPFRCIRWQ